MPTRRPKPTWVYDEWEAISIFAPHPHLPVEEREKRWQRMFDRAFVDGKWAVKESDASLVASSGFYLAWEQKEYALAGDRARTLNLHPDYRGHWDLIFHESWSDLATGNASIALKHFRDYLSHSKPNRTIRREIFVAIEVAFEAAPDKVDASDVRNFLRNLFPIVSKETRRRLASTEADSLKGLLEILGSEIYL